MSKRLSCPLYTTVSFAETSDELIINVAWTIGTKIRIAIIMYWCFSVVVTLSTLASRRGSGLGTLYFNIPDILTYTVGAQQRLYGLVSTDNLGFHS